MATFVTSFDWVTPAAYLYSSQNSIFTASNIGERTRPNRRWWATDCVSASTWVGVNFGASETIVAVMADNLNIASCKIQFDDDTAFGSVDDDSGALTVSQDDADGRYKIYYAPSSPSNKAGRILANTSTPADGSAVMKVGSLSFFTAITSWTTNLEVTVEPKRRAIGGQDENDNTKAGNDYCQIYLAGQVLPTSSESELLQLLRDRGRDSPFMLYLNDGNTSHCYMVRTVSSGRIRRPGPNHISVDGIVLREFE